MFYSQVNHHEIDRKRDNATFFLFKSDILNTKTELIVIRIDPGKEGCEVFISKSILFNNRLMIK
jgi:hypothetical protein